MKELPVNVMKLKCVVLAISLTGMSMAYADENGQNVIYAGAGSTKSSDSLNSGKTAISLGYLNISTTRSLVWGIDVSGEGTMLDSTYGQNNAAKLATSVNALIGTNLYKKDSIRIDAALLAGGREKTKSCPSSYLGYQCYADAAPDTEYAFNYGAVLTMTYKSVLFGVRATGESTQALLGLRF